MKRLLIILSVFLSVNAIAQGDIEKNIGDFDEIKVYDLINVELVKSDENKAIISGDNKSDVELINKNGSLRIKMRLGENFVGNKTVVTLYYKSIDVIDANEGSYVSAQDTFKQYNIISIAGTWSNQEYKANTYGNQYDIGISYQRKF